MVSGVELYYHPVSHYCVSAERMLAFKGVRCRLRYGAYDDRTELLRRTGQDYLPTLIWNGRPVTWSEIPGFLDREIPEPALLPKQETGLALVLENWAHQVLEERVWRAVVTRAKQTLRTEREQWVFEEMQTRARGPWHILEARREEFREEALRYLGLVDRMLRDRHWVLGEPSVADFGLYGGMSPWTTVGERIPARMADLRSWAKRISGLRPVR